jgi:hypothetical protein
MAWLVSTHRFDPVSADRVVWVKVLPGIRERIPRVSNPAGIWQYAGRIHQSPLQPDKNGCKCQI